jgi:Na+/H+ antiporter NhaD/arsenite permease-like protein
LDFIIEEAIDFNTTGLLLGMMVIVAILAETGVFYWVGIKATNLSKPAYKRTAIAFELTACYITRINHRLTMKWCQ